jgi:uncharacterized protein
MAEVKKILSIDGGGIRGVIPARILAEIEKRTNKRISELFDLIAGTSTGGIIGLALTKPDRYGKAEYEARNLIELYERNGHLIFSRSLWKKFRSVGNLIDEKYPANHIEEILDDYFGDTKLKDSLTNVLITSYEIERRYPFFFKSHKAKNNELRDFLMKEAARATSAAPTYFEPYKIKTDDPSVGYYALIDGGVYANNPAMCAYVEAQTMFKEDNFLMLSIGTGDMIKRLPYSHAKNWGLIQWAQPILNVVFDGVSDTVDYQLAQLLGHNHKGQRRYYRFQGKLQKQNENMDKATDMNIRELLLLADDIIKENNVEIDELCKQLVR